jgi:hypothetical protein
MNNKASICPPTCLYRLHLIGAPCCTWYKKSCSAAARNCDFLRPLKPPAAAGPAPLVKRADGWPGGKRGWGPVTTALNDE